MPLCVLILAAGKGTRMESDLAKVLHPLCNKPLVAWVLQSVQPLKPERTVLIVGHQAEYVEAEVQPQFPAVEFVLQPEMKGTGHAVQQAESSLRNFQGDIVVTCGDAPLIETQTLQDLVEMRRRNNGAASMLVAEIDNPGSYGRVVCGADNRVEQIVEAKDADAETLQIKRVNAGTYCFEAQSLWRFLSQINNDNASGEYYLTDVIGLMTGANLRVDAVAVSEREMTGVNTRAQLQELEAQLKSEGAC